MAYVLRKMTSEYTGLAWKFHVNPASCDNPSHYEFFLRLDALADQASGRGVTHLLIDINDDSDEISDQSNIAGFVTLRATSIISSSDGNIFVKPSLEIAELAVDQQYERRGVGTMLIDIVILMATQLNDSIIGIQNIILCADPKAVGFYENPRINFGRLENHYDLPREGWNDDCIPMYIKLNS